jgi:nucleoid-associated protein YgaU
MKHVTAILVLLVFFACAKKPQESVTPEGPPVPRPAPAETTTVPEPAPPVAAEEPAAEIDTTVIKVDTTVILDTTQVVIPDTARFVAAPEIEAPALPDTTTPGPAPVDTTAPLPPEPTPVTEAVPLPAIDTTLAEAQPAIIDTTIAEAVPTEVDTAVVTAAPVVPAPEETGTVAVPDTLVPEVISEAAAPTIEAPEPEAEAAAEVVVEVPAPEYEAVPAVPETLQPVVPQEAVTPAPEAPAVTVDTLTFPVLVKALEDTLEAVVEPVEITREVVPVEEAPVVAALAPPDTMAEEPVEAVPEVPSPPEVTAPETTAVAPPPPPIAEPEAEAPAEQPVAPTPDTVRAIPAEELLDIRQTTFTITPEVLFPDSAFESYMIQRGDFLIKIAKKEYGDWRKWRDIYRWNKEEIGDNPNLIYPYHFLDLLKPIDQVKDCDLRFTTRVVHRGETLWSIAGEVYGDPLAWIVLFWDNEEILEAGEGVLYPGMELKIRIHIDPCNPS